MRASTSRRLLRGLAAAAASLTASVALAQVPVIGPGREAEITALFAPHVLGGEIASGWMLEGIEIERATIRARLRARSGATAAITLHHLERAPEGTTRSASFAIAQEGGPRSAAARAALARALRANDDGRFWARAPLVEVRPPPWAADGEPGRRGAPSTRAPAVALALALVALAGASLALVRASPRR